MCIPRPPARSASRSRTTSTSELAGSEVVRGSRSVGQVGLRWDAPELQVASDSPRTARYRLLQSWYRESVLGARPGTYVPRGRSVGPCGSLLHPDDIAARPGINFLDPKVHSHAIQRTAEVRAEHGTLDDDRLRMNMLSSMPMCFNLFGMIRQSPAEQLRCVQQLFDPSANGVDLIECEWTPRSPASTTNDRSAFDAAVTRRPDGSRHLIGIETKYTEPFSPTRYGAADRARDAGRYRDIHTRSGWFDPSSHDDLTSSGTNQLWRSCLLAGCGAGRRVRFGRGRRCRARRRPRCCKRHSRDHCSDDESKSLPTDLATSDRRNEPTASAASGLGHSVRAALPRPRTDPMS
jgi:hypothetical protein